MDAGTSFALVVLQTELERFKYLVRSFLRMRISKIDAHPLYLLGLHESNSTPSLPGSSNPLLSPSEAQYAQTHNALLERHYAASFLSAFPPKLRRFDDKAGAGGVGMVEGPDLDKAIFVRCLGVHQGVVRRARYEGIPDDEDNVAENEEDDYGSLEVSCGYSEGAPPRNESGDASSSANVSSARNAARQRTVRMHRGEVWVVRYSSVREAIARGECELL